MCDIEFFTNINMAGETFKIYLWYKISWGCAALIEAYTCSKSCAKFFDHPIYQCYK